MARKCYKNLFESSKSTMVSIAKFLLMNDDYLTCQSVIKVNIIAFIGQA